jgi:hypothetical protein
MAPVKFKQEEFTYIELARLDNARAALVTNSFGFTEAWV